MRTITLTRGLVAVVDDEDYALVAQFKWFAVKSKETHYAARWLRTSTGPRYQHTAGGSRRQLQHMHSFILGTAPGTWSDHRDGNGLNNRRNNLRPATPSQNGANRRKVSGKSSRFKGVTLLSSGKWRALITVKGKRKYLGDNFISEELAAAAYDRAASAAFGEFALLNGVTP